MKSSLYAIGLMLLFVRCSGPGEEKKPAGPSSETISFPFKANYSSEFDPGDQKYAVIVLNGIKNYDRNEFEKSTDAFADSVDFDVPGGPVFHGTREEVVARISNYRKTLLSSESSIEAWIVLKPKDKDETWVHVWGKEVDQMQGGKKDSVYFNESWRFNKEGKSILLRQYQSKNHP